MQRESLCLWKLIIQHSEQGLTNYSKGEVKSFQCSGVPRGVLGCSTPPPEIPKSLQNCVKLNQICENC